MRCVIAIYCLNLLMTIPCLSQDGVGAGILLVEVGQLLEEIIQTSDAAISANSVEDIKAHAERVFELVWGVPSGWDGDQGQLSVAYHGWKTRWQVDLSRYADSYRERYGDKPPEIINPRDLGIIGRARAARTILQANIKNLETDKLKSDIQAIIISLNNAIGWMEMDEGVTKGERQPRVDLTREWDAPTEFWMSTADTGWLAEVYAQAINILKVDYEGDVDEARSHAEGMYLLSRKAFDGIDQNRNGIIEATKMEGGIEVVLVLARETGIIQ